MKTSKTTAQLARRRIALALLCTSLAGCGGGNVDPDAGDARPPINELDGGPPMGCWAERVARDFQGYTLWSDHVAGLGDVSDRVVAIDRPVLIDGSPDRIQVRGLRIAGEGRLVVGAADVTLRTTYILIEGGGAMTVGQEDCPFENHLTIELYGGPDSDEVLGDATLGLEPHAHGGAHDLTFGNKVLAVGNGGTLDLHGRHGTPSWTRLGANVAEGARSFVVAEEVDWRAGDRVVVTTSDFEPDHSEVREIASVTRSGTRTTVTVTEPFAFEHWGTIEAASGTDIRASVGLLSRDIVIQSEPGATYGGQTQYRYGSTARLSGVELDRLGQGGQLGRYPVHFHLTGDVRDASGAPRSYVRRCAVHDSFQRWYVLHGVRGLEVSDNVGYRAMGHGYFLEDGTETLNTLRHNLGALVIGVAQDPHWNPTNQAPVTYAEQCNPTVFWIANAYNTVVDNVAAGCTYAGRAFWLLATITEGSSPSDHRAGLSTMVEGWMDPQYFVNGRYAPVLDFRGNTGSACFTGLDTITPDGRLYECAPLFRDGNVANFELTPVDPLEISVAGIYDSYQPRHDGRLTGEHVASVIEGFTAFRNRSWGAWLRDKWYWLHRSHFADNSDSGVTLVSAGDESGIIPGYWAVMTDSHVTGFSANRYLDRGADFAQPRPPRPVNGTFFTGGRTHGKERRGVNFYDGPVAVHDTHFYNFGFYNQLFPGGAPDDNTEYLPHTAIGWFGPGNNFQYSALQEVGGLSFNERVFIRHWVYPVDYGTRTGTAPIPLLDADRQTFLLDTDGTLQGWQNSGSINNYAVHRGPVHQTECLSNESCIASPYRYGNLHLVTQSAPGVGTPQICLAKEFSESVQGGPAAGIEPFCINGFPTGPFYQWGMLSMVDATYTAQLYARGDTTRAAQVPPPNEMNLRLANVNAGAENRVSLCYPTAVRPSNFEIFVSGQEIDSEHALAATWADAANPSRGALRVALTEGETVWVDAPARTELMAPSPGRVGLRLSGGNLVVTLRQTAGRDERCYPAGFCTMGTDGQCTLAANVGDYTRMCDGERQADCASICERFGNRFAVCPPGGCLTVRIRCVGAECNTGALSPACSEESAWPETVYGPSVCTTTYARPAVCEGDVSRPEGVPACITTDGCEPPPPAGMCSP